MPYKKKIYGWTNNTRLNQVLRNINYKDRKIIINEYNKLRKKKNSYLVPSPGCSM